MTKLRAASTLVLVALLGLVFAVGIALGHKLELPPQAVLPASAAFAVLIVTLQYVIGPYLLDAILSVRWASPMDLGREFAVWNEQTCKKFKIAQPRLGIIEDGMPSAFTYGHGPWNGRVIITRGLINILDPEELKSVYAHELGHIKNRDFIMMTLIQALVLVLYVFARGSRFGNSKGTLPVVLVSYAAYWFSYYVSLLFSRLREYMADYTSAQILRDPNVLCSALVKISYGLAQTRATPPAPSGHLAQGYAPQPPASIPGSALYPGAGPAPRSSGASAFFNADMDKAAQIAATFNKPKDPKAEVRRAKQRQSTLQALGAFGIASPASMRAAVAWYSPQGQGTPDNFAQAARWELYNPWARIAEIVSTHPLTAFRIRALQKLNRLFNQPDKFDFKKVQPAKYTAFMRDLLVVALPFILLGAGLAADAALVTTLSLGQRIMLPAAGFMLGLLLKLFTEYVTSSSGRRKVLQLVSEVQVSHVNPKYVVLEGTFTGRLEAGMIWAKDFILQDETGYVACIYRQPFMLWEGLFGLFTARELVGRPVRVHGWYRRFSAPFVEIDKFEMLDTHEVRKAYHFPWLAAIYLLFVVGCAAGFVLLK